MFDVNFIWLFVAVFVFAIVFNIIIIISTRENSWINHGVLTEKAFEPKPNWRSRLKYAIPIWIIAAFFVYIMIERFSNPIDYVSKHGIERLHISILFYLWNVVFLIGMGFYTLNFRKSRFERKGKIIRISCYLTIILGGYSVFFLFADMLINGVSYLYLIYLPFFIASTYLAKALTKCDIKNE